MSDPLLSYFERAREIERRQDAALNDKNGWTWHESRRLPKVKDEKSRPAAWLNLLLGFGLWGVVAGFLLVLGRPWWEAWLGATWALTCAALLARSLA